MSHPGCAVSPAGSGTALSLPSRILVVLLLGTSVVGTGASGAQASAGDSSAAHAITAALAYSGAVVGNARGGAAQLKSWVSIQPTLQLVVHPGGTRSLRNAVVPALKVAISH